METKKRRDGLTAKQRKKKPKKSSFKKKGWNPFRKTRKVRARVQEGERQSDYYDYWDFRKRIIIKKLFQYLEGRGVDWKNIIKDD